MNNKQNLHPLLSGASTDFGPPPPIIQRHYLPRWELKTKQFLIPFPEDLSSGNSDDHSGFTQALEDAICVSSGKHPDQG